MALEKTDVIYNKAQEFGLTKQEYDKILDIMGRTPNITELGIFSVMWIRMQFMGIQIQVVRSIGQRI